MHWECIGSVSTGAMPDDDCWIEFCQELALLYIELVCGDPPPGVEVSIMSNDHDLGSYPSIGLYSEYALPSQYASACEEALRTFDSEIGRASCRERV